VSCLVVRERNVPPGDFACGKEPLVRRNAMLDGLAARLRAQKLHEPLTCPLLLLQLDEELRQVGVVVTDVQATDRVGADLGRRGEDAEQRSACVGVERGSAFPAELRPVCILVSVGPAQRHGRSLGSPPCPGEELDPVGRRPTETGMIPNEGDLGTFQVFPSSPISLSRESTGNGTLRRRSAEVSRCSRRGRCCLKDPHLLRAR
jgi:hypothetical protein